MAINNEMFVIAIGIMFSYLVLYPKNKLLGNIAYLVAGISLAYFNTGVIYTGVGILIVIGSIINAMYDILNKTQPKD